MKKEVLHSRWRVASGRVDQIKLDSTLGHMWFRGRYILLTLTLALTLTLTLNLNLAPTLTKHPNPNL